MCIWLKDSVKQQANLMAEASIRLPGQSESKPVYASTCYVTLYHLK